MNFNDLKWHDAVIKKITLNRTPTENDSISFDMDWSDGETNIIVFTGLRHLDFDLNFGFIGKENVYMGSMIESSDEIDTLKSVWLKHGVNPNIKCYEIETGTSGGTIKIFAEAFSIS